VVFVIYEDKRRKVGSVDFEGNTIATDARLRVIVKTKAQILGLFGGQLDREQVDRDVDLLEAYYFSLGFFSVKIGREISGDPEAGTVAVKYVINEGPRYRIRNIRFEGVDLYSSEELMAQIKLKPSEEEMPYFNGDSMNEDVTTLRDAYGSVGHIFAEVQAQPHFLSEPGLIDLVYRVAEGKAYRVGRVNVHIDGDGITRRNVVLNRITQKPGDLIDIRKVRQSERLLKSAELFGDPQKPGEQPRIVIRPPDEQSTSIH
jgi:outer membrane protein insertion porin family